MSGSAPYVPGQLLLTLALGEAPERLPSWAGFRRGRVQAAEKLDGGPLDRLLRHHGGNVRVLAMHESQRRKTGWNDAEQYSGVARVLQIEITERGNLPNLVDALRQLPRVESASVNPLCSTPFEQVAAATVDRVDEQQAWAPRRQLRLPEALALEPGLAHIAIGLADTGVQTKASDYAQALRHGFDAVDLRAEDASGYALVGDHSRADEDPVDDVGHGSGCAAIISARKGTLPPGAAGACEVVPVRVLGAAAAGSKRVGIGAISNIDRGMKRLIDLGVKVINMSFGTPESALGNHAEPPHAAVVRYALARGCILVAASGNSGLAERYFPAALPGVIAVGAVDEHDLPTRFTTHGAHVAVCAPGKQVWTQGLSGYVRMTGTSFAAPFVSAIVGLLAARADRRGIGLSPELARAVLIASARPFGGGAAEGYGSGVVDAQAALKALDKALDAEVFDASSTIGSPP